MINLRPENVIISVAFYSVSLSCNYSLKLDLVWLGSEEWP